MEVVRPRQVVKLTIAMLFGALLALLVCYPDWLGELRRSILVKGVEVVGGWIESHPGLAAWVQAVGSIAAIVFSLRVARKQTAAQESIEQTRRDNEIADRQRISHRVAVDHAIVIFSDVFNWGLAMARIEKAMNEASPDNKIQALANAIHESLQYGIPASVRNMFGRIHELDVVAERVQMAVVATISLQESKSNFDQAVRGELPEGMTAAEILKEVEDAVRMQLRVAQEASRALSPYFAGGNWRQHDGV